MVDPSPVTARKPRTSPKEPVKQPKAEATRARIREAANTLFLERGVDETTVDAIVAEAGVSKGTFYLYFERKEDLLLEYGAKRLRLVKSLIPELLGRPSFRDAVCELVDKVVRGKAWDQEVTRRAILEIGSNTDRMSVAMPHQVLQPLVEVARARGQVRRDMPVDVLCQFILRTVLGALRDWGMGDISASRDEALDHALTLVFDAVLEKPST